MLCEDIERGVRSEQMVSVLRLSVEGTCCSWAVVALPEDEASFTRSQLVNQTEVISTLLQAGSYLSQEYVTRKILDVLGDGDQAEHDAGHGHGLVVALVALELQFADEVEAQKQEDG